MEKGGHTSYECIYHVVLVPKYRKQHLYTLHCREVGKILRLLSERLGCEIIEGNLQKDHIHMVIKIPPKYSVAKVIGQLKGKTAIILHNEFGNKNKTLTQKNFWSRGYFIRTTGIDKNIVINYVKNQAKKDRIEDGNQLDFSW